MWLSSEFFRGSDVAVRLAACNLVAKINTGMGPNDRSSLSIQLDSYKIAIKLAKEYGDSSSHRIQLAAVKIIRCLHSLSRLNRPHFPASFS